MAPRSPTKSRHWLFLFAAASTLLSHPVLAAGTQTEIAPGTIVSAANAAQFSRYIPAAAMFALNHGFRMTLLASRRVDWSARYQRATERYSPQVRLAPDDTIRNYVAGLPFPLIDVNDPKAASKIAYNWHFGPFIPDDYALQTPRKLIAWTFPDGDSSNPTALDDYDYLKEGTCNQLRFLRYAHRTEVDPRPNLTNNSKVEWKGRGDDCRLQTGQAKAVWTRFLDPHRPDEAYYYSAEFQHAWRVDLAGYGYPWRFGKSFEQGCTYSCVEGWWDYSIPPKTEQYTYRLVGERRLLGCLDADSEPAGITGGRFGSASFQIRNAWTVEMTPRDAHSGTLRAIVDIDSESYLWLAAQFYDPSTGELVASAVPLWGHRPAADGGNIFVLRNDFYAPADRANLIMWLNLAAGAQQINTGLLAQSIFNPNAMH